MCEMGRCFPVNEAIAKVSLHHFNSSSCAAATATTSRAAPACPSLSEDEWLASVADWAQNPAHKDDINAERATFLTKAAVVASSLPPNQKLQVAAGYLCKLTNASSFGGYWVCSHRGSHPPTL